MWTLGFGAATLIFFLLALTLPGSFNPLLIITAMLCAGALGFAAAIDLGRWKHERRDRDASQPRRDQEGRQPSARASHGSAREGTAS